MLDNHPRDQLHFIIEHYGRSIIDDPRRCRGMLKDLAPKHQRETNLLMLVLEQNLVVEIIQPTPTPILMHLDKLAQRLHNNIGIQKEFALWAIESWALALEVIQQQQPSAQNKNISSEDFVDEEKITNPIPPTSQKSSHQKKSYKKFKLIVFLIAIGFSASFFFKNQKIESILKSTESYIHADTDISEKTENQTKSEAIPETLTVTTQTSSEKNKSQVTETTASSIHTKTQQIGKFIVEDGIATDTTTGLTWLRFAHGQRWENGTIVGEAQGVNWDDAMKLPATFNQQGYAGHNDWRVPTIDELKTLIDKKRAVQGIYIDAEVFSRNRETFWSSSPAVYGRDDTAMAMYFEGLWSNYGKYNSHCVRLVRG